jgi:transcription initiation factor TFIIB
MKCPQCQKKGVRVDEVNGQLVCSNCGLVITERIIDKGVHWRVYDQKDRSKIQAEPINPPLGLKSSSTFIKLRDKNDHRFRGKNLLNAMKLRRQAICSVDKSRLNLSKKLRHFKSLLNLPDGVLETAVSFCDSFLENDLSLIDSDSLVVALLYTGCRIKKVPYTIVDMQNATGVKRRSIYKQYTRIVRELKLNIKSFTPLDFIPKICSDVDMSMLVERESIKWTRKYMNKKLHIGKDPKGIAIAIVYVIGRMVGEWRSQNQLSRKEGISEVTIRNRARAFCDAMNIHMENLDSYRWDNER